MKFLFCIVILLLFSVLFYVSNKADEFYFCNVDNIKKIETKNKEVISLYQSFVEYRVLTNDQLQIIIDSDVLSRDERFDLILGNRIKSYVLSEKNKNYKKIEKNVKRGLTKDKK